MDSRPNPPKRKRKRRERLPHPGPPLVPFCLVVARALSRVPDPSVFERQVFDRFLAILSETDAIEQEHRSVRRRALTLGTRLRGKRGLLREWLGRVDRLLAVRHGSESLALADFGVPPRKKRGRKPRRGRRAANDSSSV